VKQAESKLQQLKKMQVEENREEDIPLPDKKRQLLEHYK